MIRLLNPLNHLAIMDDYDVCVWPEADGWHWSVIRVRKGQDAGVVAAGIAPTEGAALAAGEAAKPRG